MDNGRKYYDWTCYKCGLSNWEKKDSCFKCKASRYKPKDWTCDTCKVLVFGKHDKCIKCNTLNPSFVVNKTAKREGDWVCLCKEMNFASRTYCRKCNSPKSGVTTSDVPSSLMLASENLAKLNLPGIAVAKREGDWDCLCKEMNFASRTHCRKCDLPKPLDSVKFKVDESWIIM